MIGHYCIRATTVKFSSTNSACHRNLTFAGRPSVTVAELRDACFKGDKHPMQEPLTSDELLALIADDPDVVWILILSFILLAWYAQWATLGQQPLLNM